MIFEEIFKHTHPESLIAKNMTFCCGASNIETGTNQEFLYIHAYNNITFTPSASVTIQPLDCYCVIVTKQGSGFLCTQNKTYHLTNGTFCFFNCNHSHSLICSDLTWNYYILYIDGKALQYFYELFKENGSAIIRNLKPEILDAFSEIYIYPSTYSQNRLIQMRFLVNIFTDILNCDGDIYIKENTTPAYLEQIKKLFETEYRTHYTLDTLEQIFHINKYKITKDFTKHYGISPIQYLNRHRVLISKQLLIRNNNKINEISFLVGFETPNHFIKIFKKYTGTTPGVYRKSLTKNTD